VGAAGVVSHIFESLQLLAVGLRFAGQLLRLGSGATKNKAPFAFPQRGLYFLSGV
jgi:hypothetical protein